MPGHSSFVVCDKEATLIGSPPQHSQIVQVIELSLLRSLESNSWFLAYVGLISNAHGWLRICLRACTSRRYASGFL